MKDGMIRNQAEYEELKVAAHAFGVAIKKFADTVPMVHLNVVTLIDDLDQVLGAIEEELGNE